MRGFVAVFSAKVNDLATFEWTKVIAIGTCSIPEYYQLIARFGIQVVQVIVVLQARQHTNRHFFLFEERDWLLGIRGKSQSPP